MTRPHCLELFDLTGEASLEDLKTAYRDLVNVWHPDRYTHNPRLQQKAERKLQELNAAYEEACRVLAGGSTAKAPENGPAPPRPRSAPGEPKHTGIQEPLPATERWQSTETRLRAIYRNKARQEYRMRGQVAPSHPPSDAPAPLRRRRIGDIRLTDRRQEADGPATEDRNATPETSSRSSLWQTAEQHLQQLAAAREAERRRRAAEVERRRAEHEAARHAAARCRRWRSGLKWLAALSPFLALAALAYAHRQILLRWVTAWIG